MEPQPRYIDEVIVPFPRVAEEAPRSWREEVFALANGVTALRVAAGAVMLWIFDATDMWTVVVYGGGLASDWLDGSVARSRWGRETRFGQGLDPFADKWLHAVAVVVVTAGVFEVIWQLGSFVAMVTLFGFIVVGLSLWVLQDGALAVLFVVGLLRKISEYRFSSNWFGKRKMFFQGSAVGSFLVSFQVSGEWQLGWMVAGTVFVWIANGFALGSIYGHVKEI